MIVMITIRMKKDNDIDQNEQFIELLQPKTKNIQSPRTVGNRAIISGVEGG